MSKRRARGDILAALDIGSSKVACLIGRVLEDDGPIEIVGAAHQASQGVRHGRISDIAAAETCIREAVHSAETMAAETLMRFPLRGVIVNIAGTYARTHTKIVDVQIEGHEITEHDVRRAVKHAQAELLDQQPDWPLFHTMPCHYMIDGKRGITNPIGMFGDHLRVEVSFTHTDAADFESLRACLRRSHLDITGLCLNAYASAASTLVLDEIMLGSVLIDMGGGHTSFVIFQEGVMVASGAVPIGGHHITQDIAAGLNITTQSAERIKTLYGATMASSVDERDMIKVDMMGEDPDAPPHHVSRAALISIIQPRVEELMEHIRAQLDATGLGMRIGRRVILTGGAAQLQGMRDIVHMFLDRPVRLGRPRAFQGLPDAVSGPAFATTIGMLGYLYDHSELDAALLRPRRKSLAEYDGVIGKLARAGGWIARNW